jgi:hypothetical protein
LKVRPHLTDDDLARSQDAIVSLQRRDLGLLSEFAEALKAHAERARAALNAPVVLLCNAETEDVVPSPLDWNGETNVHRFDGSLYAAAKRALSRANPDEEVVVLVYHPAEDVVSVYTVSPDASDLLR